MKNEKIKKIKPSKRGLTFSFDKVPSFEPGNHFRYIIESDVGRIMIIPCKNGNTVSRKKSGKLIKSLIDLRSKEIRNMLSDSAGMEIKILENEILVTVLKKESNVKSLQAYKTENNVISISTALLMASGDITPYIEYSTGFRELDSQTQHQIKKGIPDAIRVISLFSGAGMLDSSFSGNSKFDIVYAAEYDEDAVETYKKNIGTHIACVDIRTLKGSNLPDADLIIGGPPCQPFSNANRHESSRGENHFEGDMLTHYVRLVKECCVKAFVIENVPALLSDKFKNCTDFIRNELNNYEITESIVTDSDLGGYTTRKRALIIGSRIGTPSIPKFSIRPTKTAGEALKKVDGSWPNAADITVSSELVRKKISMIPEGGNWKDLPPEYWTRSVHSNMYRRVDRNKPCIALANWRKYLLSPPKWDNSGEWDRILSVSEAAALQGLDKDFVFTGSLSAKQQQVANGVTRAMGTFIRKIIENLFQGKNKEEYILC